MTGDAPRSRRWRVPEEAAGERLDRHVAAHLDVPRNQVRRWIDDGLVTVDGAPAKASASLAAGASVEASPPPRVDDRIEPEEGELRLLHEDEHLIVLDKPAGLVVHPGAGRATGTLVHRLLARYPEIEGVGGPGRPGIVHRLDRGTSGVMVIARTDTAYRALSRAFAEREVRKLYLAVVYGSPPKRGVIETPIGRHPQRRKEMTVRPGGRPAVSRFRTLATAAGLALVEVDLGTGRTHQIRVHLKSEGYPLVGDPTYGEARYKGLPREVRGPLARFPRPALHAWRLGFEHPGTGKAVRFEAPVAGDLAELWEGVTGGEWPAG